MPGHRRPRDEHGPALPVAKTGGGAAGVGATHGAEPHMDPTKPRIGFPPNPVKADSLGGRLRRLREARGLSQQQAADVAGVRRATLSAAESGGSSPLFTSVVRWLASWGVTRGEAAAVLLAELPLRRRKPRLTSADPKTPEGGST